MVQDDLRIHYNIRGNDEMRDVKETIVMIERNMRGMWSATVQGLNFQWW
jgi:hypothetical protein